MDQLANNKANLDYVIQNFTNRNPGDIPYYLGEYHLTNPENCHNIQLVAGLFTAKCLGYSAGSLRITVNAIKDGDHGFLARNGSVYSWILSGDSLALPTCILNGVGNGLAQGGPVVEDVTPYYWSVGSTSSINVNIEKFSVTSMVIY